MWLLVRDDYDLKKKLDPADFPTVPSHPLHLICVDCVPQDGCDMMEPAAVLPEEVMEEIPGIQHYVYGIASRVDYNCAKNA